MSAKKQFHFVDLSDCNHKQKARSHLVREHIRQLKWRGHLIEDAESQRTKVVRSSKIDDALSLTPRCTKKRRYGERITLGDGVTSSQSARKPPTERGPCCLSPGGLDPFQALPVESSPEVLLLIHHYIKVIPTLLPSSAQVSNRQHQPAIDLFRLYCLHPASTLGMLYHAASHRQSLEKNPTRESLSVTFKIKTLQEVNRQIENARRRGVHPDNGTIMGIYLLSVAERMWGDLDTFRLHWRAMNDIIDAKGGADAFVEDDQMFAKTVWNCFALLNARDGYYSCPRTTLATKANYDFRIPANFMTGNCHYFGMSFTQRKATILRLLPNTEADALLQDAAYPRRINAFQPGTVLHRVIHPQYNPCVTAPDSAAQGSSIQIQGDRSRRDNCRLACVIYINLFFTRLGDFSEATESFLSTLERHLKEDTALLSPEYLLWILLRTPVVISRRESREVWAKAIQIIAVVKRARYHNVIQYHEAMSLFLELPKDASKLTPALKVDLETIQGEALGFTLDQTSDSWYYDCSNESLRNPTPIPQTYSELLWFVGGA
ncbi:hypothetical protein BBP40_005731 [Aspergillus hancockii]|nr:hypothetical protein BBP40_005731 [Aspergillus hancockii]